MAIELKTGSKTMGKGMECAFRYHEYLFSKIRPFLGKRVLEIGSGFGQYTRKIANSGFLVQPSEVDGKFLDNLRKLESPAISKAIFCDLTSSESCRQTILAFNPDTIVCINVLEHMEKDIDCLKNLTVSLPEKSKIIILVPAFQSIYNILDHEAGHFRRYSPNDINNLLIKSGWKPRIIRFINAPGLIGWILAGILNKGKGTHCLVSDYTSLLIKTYDVIFIPLAKLSDLLFKRLFGLSILAIADKI